MKTEICKGEDCTGCKLCSNVCPKKCIDFFCDDCGFEYPKIDHEKCIECDLCRKKCPSNNVYKTNIGKFYMAINNDEEVLKESSSGGAFSAISSYVLSKNGVVVGAAFIDKKIGVRHIIIESEKDLFKIRKSKYFQSDTKDIYQQVLNCLKDNRLVLFSGTACQIAAINSFVPNNYKDNLITVDVLCHGVSSKKIVDRFIESEESRFKKIL